MENIKFRTPKRIESCTNKQLWHLNNFDKGSAKFEMMHGATPMNFEKRQICFSNSFRKNIDNSLRKIADEKIEKINTRHFSMLKNRSHHRAHQILSSPVSSSKRKTRSRLRHPKIAIPRKNHRVIKAFCIQSDLDEDLSIFLREENEKSNYTQDDMQFFRPNSDWEEKRLETPGFVTQ